MKSVLGPDEPDPQAAGDRRRCARHLLQRPLTCAEHDPEIFRLIRRHEAALDQWFTQRLGYRLHINADTARLFKTGAVPDRRPLRARTGRAFRQDEYTMLALVLAATAAGPDVISLRDLINEIRSAAAEAGVVLTGDGNERRAVVSVLSWMIDHGMAGELFEHIDAYVTDSEADAVLKLRPDRIMLAPIPALVSAADAEALVARTQRHTQARQWMRCRLVEDPVLYRTDLSEAEWGELRRRIGEEERILDEMFGLVLEVRAEGMAAIDPSGSLADRAFPAGGTVGHAALLLIDVLLSDTSLDGSSGAPSSGEDEPDRSQGDDWHPFEAALVAMEGPIAANARRWSNELVDKPETLVRRVLELLADVRLAQIAEDGRRFRLLPAACRFAVSADASALIGDDNAAAQEALW